MNIINTNIVYNNLVFITSPLDQFEIRDLLIFDAPLLGNLHLSLTNITLYLFIGFLISLNLNIIGDNYNKIVTNN
jgi:F-type H+-transporting ATPase subunit a